MADESTPVSGAGRPGGTGGEPAAVCVVCGTGYPPDTAFCPLDGAIVRAVKRGGDLAGTVLDGRYFLVEQIGQGGMGDVYLGEHVRTQRRCAVKVVSRARATDPEALGRFLREATNAGRINHPHVATIYDFGETGEGIAYLAMEYVDGEPLSTLLSREGALAPERAATIARQVAEAVAAAHELGIVHRDLKPANILVARDRRGGDHVKVVDFGIARVTADAQQNLTRVGVVVGTPEYMSPEQLFGEEVDGRSDMYSLGCVLYQMLTGAQAFEGPTAQVITRRLTEKPPRPRERNPAVPRALDAITTRALARQPDDRYPTMDAMRDALAGATAAAPRPTVSRLATWLGLGGQQPAGSGDTPGNTGPFTAPRPTQSRPPVTGSRNVTPPATTGGTPAARPGDVTGNPPAGTPATPAPAEPPVAPEMMNLDPAWPADAEVDDIPMTRVASALPGLTGAAGNAGGNVAGNVGGTAGADAAADATPAAGDVPSADDGPVGDEAGAVTDGGEPDAEAAVEAVETVVVGGAEAPAPRSRLPRLAAGVVGVLLLGSVVALFSRPRGGLEDAVVEPPPVEAPPPPPLWLHVLEVARTEMALAEADEQAFEFVRAIRRLEAVESRLEQATVEYPDVADVRLLADSASALAEELERRCNAFRQVEIARGQDPPACRPQQ